MSTATQIVTYSDVIEVDGVPHVYGWPDGSWCWADELEETLQCHSDDYALVPLDSIDDE